VFPLCPGLCCMGGRGGSRVFCLHMQTALPHDKRSFLTRVGHVPPFPCRRSLISMMMKACRLHFFYLARLPFGQSVPPSGTDTVEAVWEGLLELGSTIFSPSLKLLGFHFLPSSRSFRLVIQSFIFPTFEGEISVGSESSLFLGERMFFRVNRGFPPDPVTEPWGPSPFFPPFQFLLVTYKPVPHV